jgi:Raf kinase inhibitor-like YbhB/YbcL family protein
MRKALWFILTLGFVLSFLTESRAENASGGFSLTSTAFAAGQPIPKRYTCDGENVSPPLAWSGAPAAAKSFVLIVDDPDAPGGTFTHWLVFNLPPTAKSLPEGLKPAALPAGAAEGVNGFGKADYGGPCPPKGRHRYVHQLYALDTRLSGLTRPTRKELDAALQGHVLARATLMGTYQR